MMKKISFVLPILLAALMTACASSEANRATPPGQPAQNPQEVKAQGATPDNGGTVKADGAVSTIPASQPAPTVAAPPAAAAPAPTPVPAGPAPKLFLAAKKVDFGKVKEDTTINRTIVLKNTGQGELKIEAVTPSCGCTAVDFPKTIASGKSGTIKYKVDTGKGAGARTKTITIKSNDPDEPTITYEFSFTVK